MHLKERVLEAKTYFFRILLLLLGFQWEKYLKNTLTLPFNHDESHGDKNSLSRKKNKYLNCLKYLTL